MTDPSAKDLADLIERFPARLLADKEIVTLHLTEDQRDTILSALRARAPGEEEIARAAMGAYYSTPLGGHSTWSSIAKAVLALLSQPQGEGQPDPSPFASGWAACRDATAAVIEAKMQSLNDEAIRFAPRIAELQDCQTAIAALTPPADAWRPIDAEAKASDDACIWVPHLGPRPAYWVEGGKVWVSPVSDAETYNADEVTLWQPLPSPPQDRSGQ